jgi:signal transduction histidine kinase
MTALVSCPNCDLPVDPQAQICDHCGVNLAVAAVLAEGKIRISLPDHEGISITPEILVPRLGDLLLEKGLISLDDLKQALEYQKQQANQGKPVLLGYVLRELQLIDRETLDQVITEQILELQAALRRSNLQLEQRIQERTSELQNALEKLTEHNRLKANFIANISHELRTPLTHMKGYLDIFLQGGFGELSKEQREALQVLKRAEERLERLIEDLIQFSLASRGKLTLKLTRENLNDLVEHGVAAMLTRAESAGIGLRSQLSSENLPIKCDRDKISWVISQLLDNSLKFTGTGGKVEVITDHKGGFATIEVRDSGIGIPADRLDEIFMPFHQLDGSPTRRYGGTGLGLALCKQIVDAHRAYLQVFSEVGKGTRFVVLLPINEDE